MTRGNRSFAHLARPSTRRAPRGDAPAISVSQAPAPSHVDSSSSAARASTTTTARGGARGSSLKRKRSPPAKAVLPAGAIPVDIVEGVLVVSMPIAVRNEANGDQWARFAKSTYRKKTRNLVRNWMSAVPRVDLPVTVTLIRHAAGSLDKHDGLPGAFKSVVDELAVWLGLPTNKRGHADDNDPRVTWKYDQAKCAPRTTWIEVRFEPREAGRAA